MFNITKGRLSLNVFCSPDNVLIKRAPDDESHPDLVKIINRGETELARIYLRQIKADYPEATLMRYFDSRGYTVTKLAPKLFENALGEMSVAFL